MGSNISLPDEYPQECETQPHPRLKQVHISPANPALMYMRHRLDDSAQFKKWKRIIQSIPKATIEDAHILLPEWYQFEHAGLCGNGGMLFTALPRYQHNLSTELSLRKQAHSYLEQQGIWYLLFKLCKAETAMYELAGRRQSSDIMINITSPTKSTNVSIFVTISQPPKHQPASSSAISLGWLRCDNILLNEQGEFKLLVPWSFPNESSSELGLKHGDCQLNDFWLGITLAEVATLKVFAVGLDFLDEISIQSMGKKALASLKDLNYLYSSRLLECIRKLLLSQQSGSNSQSNASKQIYQSLKAYQPFIQNMEAFGLDHSVDLRNSFKMQKSFYPRSNQSFAGNLESRLLRSTFVHASLRLQPRTRTSIIQPNQFMATSTYLPQQAVIQKGYIKGDRVN